MTVVSFLTNPNTKRLLAWVEPETKKLLLTSAVPSLPADGEAMFFLRHPSRRVLAENIDQTVQVRRCDRGESDSTSRIIDCGWWCQTGVPSARAVRWAYHGRRYSLGGVAHGRDPTCSSSEHTAVAVTYECQLGPSGRMKSPNTREGSFQLYRSLTALWNSLEHAFGLCSTCFW